MVDRHPLTVVGVDGSPASTAAVRWAVDAGRGRARSVRLLHAVAPPPPGVPCLRLPDRLLAGVAAARPGVAAAHGERGARGASGRRGDHGVRARGSAQRPGVRVRARGADGRRHAWPESAAGDAGGVGGVVCGGARGVAGGGGTGVSGTARRSGAGRGGRVRVLPGRRSSGRSTRPRRPARVWSRCSRGTTTRRRVSRGGRRCSPRRRAGGACGAGGAARGWREKYRRSAWTAGSCGAIRCAACWTSNGTRRPRFSPG